MTWHIRRLTADDVDLVLRSAHLFDGPPTGEWTRRFFASPGHHLVVALADDGVAAGFASGIVMTHPDKGSELFLYELGVDERFRQRGIGRRLVEEMTAIAREEGCYGGWVLTEPGNTAARRTYASAGWREDPERSAMFVLELED